MGDKAARVAGYVAEVAPKTRWIFVEIETKSGLTGVGEASLSGRERDVLQVAGRLAEPLFAGDAEPGALPAPTDLPEAAAVSAIDQALWDIAGQRADRPVAELLGGLRRESVRLYANINRRTANRSPAGFAASARDAIAAGYSAIKIAPFDEVKPGNPAQPIGPGLDRIAAAREAIGPERDLLVDCHWRLLESSAAAVIRAAAEQRVYWVECPLPERDENLDALRRLRGLANARGVRLAGCEQGIGEAGFAPFLRAGAYDAMMPDAKYVGGLAEMLRLAEVFAQAGVAFSPHNPTGPVCHAASLQICAAAASFDRLELQFDETPLFAALAGNALPEPSGGASALPKRAGLGVKLAAEVLQGCEITRFERNA